MYIYNPTYHSLKVMGWAQEESAPEGEYLLILKDKSDKQHYVGHKWSEQDETYDGLWFDEIYLGENAPLSSNESIDDRVVMDLDLIEEGYFDAIYTKKTA